MEVRDWMTKEVLTVSGATGIRGTAELMKAQKIRHLPVVERGRLIGIVTDRDVRDAIPSQATSSESHELHNLVDNVRVRDIMSRWWGSRRTSRLPRRWTYV